MIDSNEVIALQQQLSQPDGETAYIRLYRIYYAALLQFALSFVPYKPAAEEIVSDVFLQLWRMRYKLSHIQNLTVYLYTCIRNHSLNYLRKRRRDTQALDENMLSIPSDDNPEQRYITSELTRKINATIEQLPEKCRLIFKLVREDGLKYREVADILDISVKTVETQMGIALKKISLAIQPNTSHDTRSTIRSRPNYN